MVIHVQYKWLEASIANLWTYALRHANNAYNDTALLAHPQGLSLPQLFTLNKFQDNQNHWHPFFCPTYFLNETLRSS